MATGLINCGLGLGAATGPIVSGAITDLLDYAWAETVIATLSAFMVSLFNMHYLVYDLQSTIFCQQVFLRNFIIIHIGCLTWISCPSSMSSIFLIVLFISANLYLYLHYLAFKWMGRDVSESLTLILYYHSITFFWNK